jgi:hypothetical protein
MEPKLAYLAQGRLFYRDNGTAELIDSQYGQEVVKRALERQAKNEWKTGGSSSAALYSRQSLWGTGADSPNAINVRTTAVFVGKSDDELMYVVSTESVGGLFSYNLKTKKETRIFHKEKLYLTDVSRQPAGDMIVCSWKMHNGTARIGVVQGTGVDEITEGDSVDEAPAWVPGGGKKIVYQSAGVARNQSGIMMGVGHTSIQKLDLEKGAMETLAENESYDYLSPKVNAKGDLLFVRRPYEPAFRRSYPAHKIFLDVVLFPFRLGRAVFHYLNFFSIAFSKKPLTTASGPKIEGVDEKELFLRGRMIDAEQYLQDQASKSEAPALVPRSWQLIRRSSDGKESTLADSVLSYDLAPDGTIVYTTGMAVFQTDSDGNDKKLLFKGKLVDTVVLLNSAVPGADGD